MINLHTRPNPLASYDFLLILLWRTWNKLYFAVVLSRGMSHCSTILFCTVRSVLKNQSLFISLTPCVSVVGGMDVSVCVCACIRGAGGLECLLWGLREINTQPPYCVLSERKGQQAVTQNVSHTRTQTRTHCALLFSVKLPHICR